jgi:cytochrome c biogenesis protein CcdA
MYFLGVSGRPGTQRATVRRALLVSAALSAGFMTVFVIVGGISRLFTDWLNQNAKYVALLIGVALVILGIAMLFGYRLPFSTPKLETGKRDQTIASMYVFGLAYAIASISCSLGLFSSTVLGTIDTDGFFQGIIAVVLYGAAMSLLITTLTVTLALAQGGLLKSLRTGMKYVEIASAIVMILSGLYLSWYWFNGDDSDDNITGHVLSWQGRIVQYIDNNRLVLAIVFAVIVGSALTYTFVSRRRDLERSS